MTDDIAQKDQTHKKKMQKQKEDAIGRAARERQKMIDEKNALIRKGMVKSATSADIFGGLERKFSGMISSAENIGEEIKEMPNKIFLSALPNDNADSKEVEQSATTMDSDTVEFTKGAWDWGTEKYNDMTTAGGDIADTSQGVSMTPDHPNFPSPEFGNFDVNIWHNPSAP